MAGRPLADFLDGCLGATLAARGFAGSAILTDWAEIVGEELARRTEPVRLVWPRQPRNVIGDDRRSPATLLVRSESAFALDLQHRAPVVVERINSYFGWRCVEKLRLEQGPVGRGRVRRAARPEPSQAIVAEVHALSSGIEDADLQAALVRLGTGILARSRR